MASRDWCFLNCVISYLRLAKNSVKRLPLIHREIHSQSLGLKQHESSDPAHPNKLSGSPVKYSSWALGGKMSNIIHVSEERGEMERQTNSDWGAFPGWRNKSKVCVHMNPEFMNWGQTASTSVLLNADLHFSYKSFRRLNLKLASFFLTSGQLVRV